MAQLLLCKVFDMLFEKFNSKAGQRLSRSCLQGMHLHSLTNTHMCGRLKVLEVDTADILYLSAPEDESDYNDALFCDLLQPC